MKKATKNKISYIVRTSVLVIMMVSLSFLSVVRLLKIQIVDIGAYVEQTKPTYTAEQTIQAARGQILDSKGRKLNTNEIVYKVIMQRAFLPVGEENDIIAGTLAVLMKSGEEWIDSAPISMEAPYVFQNAGDAQLDKFKEQLGLNYDATVGNCLKAFVDNYGIDTEKYDEQMIRYIGGVRYEMELRDFSFRNRYMFAEDVSMAAIIELKEKSPILKGVDIVEEPIRIYLDGTAIPHIRGRINAINEQQYNNLKDSGYSLNDVIGFFGIEDSMESTLRGNNGIREITRDSSGTVIGDVITKNVQAGKSVKLTIDTEFQRTVEEILANHINWLNNKTSDLRGVDCFAGAVVVLDAKTGAILAMANNPSYNLDDYVELMLAEDRGEPLLPDKPLLNRAAAQGYRPGSAFKTITCTAGLINGVIGRNDTVFCGGKYTFYADYQPGCTGVHGSISAVSALRWSCNCYFYDVGRRLGIDRLSSVAELFGVGTNLNCDIYNYPGIMTTPEVYEELIGSPLTPGDTIQAAIGQSENLLTPLHMAVVGMTLANQGVRYRPYLVDSVWNYDCTEMIYQTRPEIVADFSEGNENSFSIVREGMVFLASDGTNWPLYTPNNHFAYLPDYPAIKTGTPELINKKYNSTVLGFYPANDPQIAFGIVLEEGEFSRFMVRNIIDAYFYGCYEPEYNEDGNIANPWKRWDAPREPIR
ncbi:MAG: hypothetical protein LBI36_05235 [Oscillospiraceae bacterium]|jgi:penicillin-binding protein 2|nr:hypothetical protein [Oscillospiraceae bacterium]